VSTVEVVAEPEHAERAAVFTHPWRSLERFLEMSMIAKPVYFVVDAYG
jgi:hypothetical protein